jgi:TolB protein
LKHSKHLLRPTAIVLLSLFILAVVIQFAPTVQAPTDAPAALMTQVAAATAAPHPTEAAPAASLDVPAETDAGTLVFSAERGGHWELYAAPVNGIQDFAQWKQLTRGYDSARNPALSPDGTRLAFQSRKDGNWEIYVLDFRTGAIARLTDNLAYDGGPSWSPDGKQIAFESYRANKLDVWRMDADGKNLVNLTADVEAYNFAPAWSPDGKTIVYTSWVTGNQQLFAMTPDGKNRLNLSNNRFHDEHPVWSPDGKQIAFVSNREGCVEHVQATVENPPPRGGVDSGNCQRRTIFVAAFDGTKLSAPQQVTYLGRDLAPVWSPDGKQIAFIAAQPAQQPLYITAPQENFAHALTDAKVWIDSAAWSPNPVNIGTTPVNEPPLYVDKPIPSNPEEGTQYDFVGMKDVYLAPSWGILSSTVSDSYRALRQRVLRESGIDFLATLSDMTRLIGSRCDNTCDNLSWHKSGRAVDTLLTMPVNGSDALLLVREDVGGEVYWHLYLRAAKQDGTMGEPLTDAPWDLSYTARANLAAGQGGMERAVANGYYVDLTTLARIYGWTRISSHDDVDFDWRNNREALEFWHFQKEDGLTWWQAMQQVYPPQVLAKNFDYDTIVNAWDIQPSRVYLKDIPPPPSAWKWNALVPKP